MIKYMPELGAEIFVNIKKMLRIEKFQQDKVQLWNNFNKNAKNGLFMFDRNYMDYHSDRFKDNSLIFYEDEKPHSIASL